MCIKILFRNTWCFFRHQAAIRTTVGHLHLLTQHKPSPATGRWRLLSDITTSFVPHWIPSAASTIISCPHCDKGSRGLTSCTQRFKTDSSSGRGTEFFQRLSRLTAVYFIGEIRCTKQFTPSDLFFLFSSSSSFFFFFKEES